LTKYLKIANIKDIPQKTGKKVQVNGKSIALFKYEDNIFALNNRCPHQGADISDGFVKEGRAVCPLHGWSFDLETGAFIGNENTRIRTYEIKVEGNDVLIGLENE